MKRVRKRGYFRTEDGSMVAAAQKAQLRASIPQIRKLNEILEQDEINLDALRIHSMKYGLPTNDMRRRVWRRILGIPSTYVLPTFKDIYRKREDNVLEPNKYTNIVNRDIDRSLWTYCPDAQLRGIMRTRLDHLINAVLDNHPDLHYFQGFHDIASVIMLVCGVEDGLAYAILERISVTYIRDFMTPGLETAMGYLNLLYPLLEQIQKRVKGQTINLLDSAIWNDTNDVLLRNEYGEVEVAPRSLVAFMRASEAPPYFSLSWLLTWFSHVIEDIDMAAHLFDFFLASHALMPIYMIAAVVAYGGSRGLLELPCEMSAVHHYYSSLPVKHRLPYRELLTVTEQFAEIFPPSQLIAMIPSIQEPINSKKPLRIPSTSALFQYPFPGLLSKVHDDELDQMEYHQGRHKRPASLSKKSVEEAVKQHPIVAAGTALSLLASAVVVMYYQYGGT